MAYIWQRWLADEFRAAGLSVVEIDGWENRGRPASTGSYDPNGALTVHHTGTATSLVNARPTLPTLVTGRPDLPGPLAPFSVAADGTVIVIAAGRCNHAGRVGKSGVLGMPYGADGNALAMGDEVDTSGTQPLPEAQRRAMAIAHRVVLDHFNRGPEWAHRHADISTTGKWDLGSLTTQQVRDDIAAATTTAPQEDFTMDENTKAWFAQRFTTLRRQNIDIAKAQAKIATGTADLLEVVADIEGLTADTKKRVGAAKTQILAAIDELDACTPDAEE